MATTLFTVGHSNHPLGYFLSLLHLHTIETLCDVRTTPYSRHHPQFNQRMLRAALENERIGYLHLGQSLGGKPKDPGYPNDPRVRFAVIAATSEFRVGMARLLEETRARRTAILCAERDPAVCHRTLLVCAHLPADVSVRHILADGSLRTPEELAVDKGSGDQQGLPLGGPTTYHGRSTCEANSPGK